MRYIVITSERAIDNEAAIINSLFAVGLERLHLRKPTWTIEQTDELLLSIDKQYWHKIASHYPSAYQSELGGYHNPMGSSRSCHSLNEIRQYKHQYDYLFLSPIFDSISKSGYKAGFDTQELACSKLIDERVVALGGICKSNIPILKQMGFTRAALLGYIWNSPQPLLRFAALRIKN